MSSILSLIVVLVVAYAFMYLIGAAVRRAPDVQRWVFDHFGAMTFLSVALFAVMMMMVVINLVDEPQLIPSIVIDALWVMGLVVFGVSLGARRDWLAAVDRNEGVVLTRDSGVRPKVVAGSDPASVADVRSAVLVWAKRWERYGRSVDLVDLDSGLEVRMERGDRTATLVYQADGKLSMSFSDPLSSEPDVYEVSSPESVDTALHYFGQRFAEIA